MADLSWITDRPIAHRGLHDLAAGRPENSLAAFRAAMAHGYAIECDLQLSADSVPVVYHDDTLDRLTDHHGPLKDRPARTLAQITLSGTGETIPELGDLLALVSGQVPIILELKDNGDCNPAFAKAVCTALRDYEGPVAVMSFDHEILRVARDVAHGLPRGLVAEGDWRTAVTHLTAILRLGLHFLSYDVDDLPTPAPWIAQRILGMPLICWTVRTEGDRRRATRWSGQMTFEGFLP